MIQKCACQGCGGDIEFDAADFSEQTRDSTDIIGQQINCPHCGSATAITMPVPKAFKQTEPKRRISRVTIAIVAIIGAALVPALIVIALDATGKSLEDVVTGGAGFIGVVIMLIVVVFAFILAVLWLVFPWLVYSMLSKIHSELQKIEHNTRRP